MTINHINQLPNEVFLGIFKLLNKRDLISVQSVCIFWANLTQSNDIWKQLYQRESFHAKFLKIYNNDKQSFQSCYKTYSIAQQNFKRFSYQSTILIGHSENITSIQFNGTLNQIISSSFDKTIRIWDYNNLSNVKTIDFNSTIMDMQLDYTNTNLICGSDRGHIYFLNLHDHKVQTILQAHYGFITSIQGNESSRIFCSASGKDKMIKMWDLQEDQLDRKLVRCLENDRAGVSNLVWSNRNSNVLYSSSGSEISQWDVEYGIQIRKLQTQSIINPDCLQVCNGMIASGGESKIMTLFDERMQFESKQIPHDSPVYAIQYDPSERRLVSGHGQDNNNVNVWDTDQCIVSKYHNIHSSSVNILHLDRKRVISASLDSNIVVWDCDEPQEMAYKLKGHTSMIRTCYFDDSKIISGSLDNSVILWDFANSTQQNENYNNNNNRCMIM
ncbi:WD40 repeat-containing protein [Tieghemostelium lacteum]|uniref:WD40 repeat-containing protein n=1 Tax=Tieghemostelium lacteum TaxID=361077 RepID=A0A152A3H9_TIELA|nr:WD40 repeat-containing protein [Tieghemostelium lacteum]|eukprot:KYR00770.1 WD40 repeat-containing protein [Tieghemostelium lacteum]